MVGIVHQHLHGLLEGQNLVAEGVGIVGQIEILAQLQPFGGGHGDRSVKADMVVHRDMVAQIIAARRHQHAAPGGGHVGGLERGAVVGDAVAHGAEITNVDPVHQVAQIGDGDILDHEILDPHDAAVAACQVQPEMADDRNDAPGHVDAATRTAADDGRHLDHVAVGGQRHLGASRDKAGDLGRAARARPASDAHRRQVARHRLDPRPNAQIAARQHRCFPDIAQILRAGGLDQLQRVAKILIARHQGSVGGAVIGCLPGQPVLAGPVRQSVRKLRRHQLQPVGDRLVHPLSFPVRCGQETSGPVRREGYESRCEQRF